MFKHKNYIKAELVGEKVLLECSFDKSTSNKQIINLINTATDQEEVIKSFHHFAAKNNMLDKFHEIVNSLIPSESEPVQRLRMPLIHPSQVFKTFSNSIKD